MRAPGPTEAWPRPGIRLEGVRKEGFIHIGFPPPDTQVFRPFATGPVVDPAAMNLSKGLTLTNATIPAGTNPTFGGTVIIQGVLVVESPNIVTFNRNCQLNGVIVGDGGSEDSAENQIRFAGNFATGPFPTGEAYAKLIDLAGTSIPPPLPLLPSHPADKYSVVIPNPRVQQRKRPRERLRNGLPSHREDALTSPSRRCHASSCHVSRVCTDFPDTTRGGRACG
jgi:hypothetical protein